MAQTRKKRRRKHRGTQGGGLDRRGPRGRPRNREEAKSRARKRQSPKGARVDRRDLAPTWSGAFKRGLFGAGIFFLLFWLAFQRPVGSALALSAVMLAMYVPMGYYIDRFMYQRRLRQLQAARAAKKQQG
jgi:hypothetical protein